MWSVIFTVEVWVGSEENAECSESMLERLPQKTLELCAPDPHGGASSRLGEPRMA